jgi:hypothetical protein
LGAHESGPRAGDIGFPERPLETHTTGGFPPPGSPSGEIILLSRTIMPAASVFGNGFSANHSDIFCSTIGQTKGPP